jgi:hypothetical protein
MAGPVLSVAGSGAAQGQQAPAATPATPPALAKASDTPASATSTGKMTLNEGADVSLKFAQDLSSKTAAEDNPVNLVLAEDLKIGDVVIAKSGAKAVGTITHMKKAGMMGEAGELNMRLQYLLVGDTRVELRGTKGKDGQGKAGTAVALTVLFGPIGLIKTRQERGYQRGDSAAGVHRRSYELPANMCEECRADRCRGGEIRRKS